MPAFSLLFEGFLARIAMKIRIYQLIIGFEMYRKCVLKLLKIYTASRQEHRRSPNSDIVELS